MEQDRTFRTPYAVHQLLAALAYDLRTFVRFVHANIISRIVRAALTKKVAIAITLSITVALSISLVVETPVSIAISFGDICLWCGVKHDSPTPPSSPPVKVGNPACSPKLCAEETIEDGEGRKARARFLILGEDSYWKIGSKDYIVSPSRGEIHVSDAFDAIYTPSPFEGVKEVIGIGVASAGIKVSNEDEETLAGQRASVLLDQVRPKLGRVPFSTLNLGRYKGDRDYDHQRPPLIACVFESDPGIKLGEALLGTLRTKHLYGLDVERFSKMTTATLRPNSSSR